jgi:hypothetical protein
VGQRMWLLLGFIVGLLSGALLIGVFVFYAMSISPPNATVAAAGMDSHQILLMFAAGLGTVDILIMSITAVVRRIVKDYFKIRRTIAKEQASLE